jgi:hypothetical protein
MKDVMDFAKWLLKHDIRAKNAVSFLVALLSLIAFYFESRYCQWFLELHQGYGAGGTAVTMLVVFLTAFLGVWLVYSGIAAHHGRVISWRQAWQKAERQERTIRENLDSLTEWQRSFLLRFIVENRRQIPEWDVGQYGAAWDFEMSVLLNKRIVKAHSQSGTVYEIEPLYYAYVKEHWNPCTSTLE